MKTIVIASQKGGSGKTTLTELLAVEAERSGDSPAWVIDTDRNQASLTHWHDRRDSETPGLFEVALPRLPQAVAQMQAEGAAYCFIDTPPTVSEQTAAAVALADLVLMPVQPSPNDLWATADTVAMVKNAGKPFLFVVMKAKAQASITAQTIAALSQHGRVAQAFTGDRVTYAMAITDGRTAPEIAGNRPAAAEVSALWKEIKSCFNESSKPTKQRRSISNG